MKVFQESIIAQSLHIYQVDDIYIREVEAREKMKFMEAHERMKVY